MIYHINLSGDNTVKLWSPPKQICGARAILIKFQQGFWVFFLPVEIISIDFLTEKGKVSTITKATWKKNKVGKLALLY